MADRSLKECTKVYICIVFRPPKLLSPSSFVDKNSQAHQLKPASDFHGIIMEIW